jgi:hypothetical protein
MGASTSHNAVDFHGLLQRQLCVFYEILVVINGITFTENFVEIASLGSKVKRVAPRDTENVTALRNRPFP